MAMKTERGCLLHPFGIFERDGIMAGRARFIFIHRLRQSGLRFMTCAAAIFFEGFGIRFRVKLIVGIVALDTIFVFFGLFHLFSTVDPVVQVIHYIVVTFEAMIRSEKVD